VVHVGITYTWRLDRLVLSLIMIELNIWVNCSFEPNLTQVAAKDMPSQVSTIRVVEFFITCFTEADRQFSISIVQDIELQVKKQTAEIAQLTKNLQKSLVHW